MFNTIMAVDEEFGNDLYDCVKNNAKVHGITLNPQVIMPTSGLINPGKATGVVKEFVSPRGYDEEFEYEDTPKREDSFLEKLKAKLKGVSEEQMEYNRKHSLPLDWRGSKEGYHEHITNKQFYSGSN